MQLSVPYGRISSLSSLQGYKAADKTLQPLSLPSGIPPLAASVAADGGRVPLSGSSVVQGQASGQEGEGGSALSSNSGGVAGGAGASDEGGVGGRGGGGGGGMEENSVLLVVCGQRDRFKQRMGELEEVRRE